MTNGVFCCFEAVWRSLKGFMFGVTFDFFLPDHFDSSVTSLWLEISKAQTTTKNWL